ncbi:1-(5-phosphoribosyl)-5-[(5-phosphoribosylamino)methylideneamino] imidazole-4-carboxamide isomerase [Candidatus Micrarchaeota archaeon]|nr:1-(5-phosphoribosyl)-5-[(5-phosphoribosylamino)methylideneamino] imidazole-4-carboxamide isomerase [Candidatus Micrarchaeota archaeon]
MIIIPAIDLMGGECVRLVKGEKENKITYGKSPLEVAMQYMAMGAKIIHVVDLDGAFTGEMKNISIIRELAAKFPIQVGGGIRSEEKVAELLGLGVKKVIVSTLLMKDLELAAKLKQKYCGKLVGSFDFKDGKLSYAGWTQKSELPFEEVAAGLEEIVVTDTSRDGTYLGPNLELLEDLKGRCNARIVSAGGVRNAQDLVALSEIGIYGAIAGRAFLENRVELGGMGFEIGGE